MGFLKALTIREVLLTGRHVLVSDSDVVWLRDPTPELQALAANGVHVAPSTDCIDVQSDRDKRERERSSYLCGHHPGSKGGAVFNTGIIFFAASNETTHFCTRWANTTLTLRSDQWWSDDQGVFNRLLTGHGSWPFISTGFYPVQSAGMGGRLIRGPAELVLAPLATERFCPGHLVWVQQAARPMGCFAVHATFTEFGDAGKRWRFLEAGLWGPLPERYFTEGRFLTFDPPKPPADPAPCEPSEGVYVDGGRPVPPCGGEDPRHTLKRPKTWGDVPAEEGAARSLRLRWNLELMRRQLHALRDAAAVAYLLNRTLILPHFDCLCDRSELVDYIPSCVFPGAPARLAFPLKCSTHFVLNIHKLLYLQEPTAFGVPSVGRSVRPLPLRAHAFLEDPRARDAIAASVAVVSVTGTPAALETQPRCSAPHERTCRPPLVDTNERMREFAARDSALSPARPAITVPLRRGASDGEILASLETPALRDTRLLRLSDAEGVFGSWDTRPDDGSVFNDLERYYMLGGDFCCTSRRANEGRLYPVDPPLLRVTSAD